MVDCGNLRCFQERRTIKKELLSWGKKVPIAVGLETIAENLGSRRKVKKLFEPFNCLESKEPQDWEPEENCFYCKDRIQLLFDAIEKTDTKGGGKILRDHPSLRHLGDILPFCPQFYTSNFGRDILTDIKTCQNEPPAPPPPPPPPPPPEPTPPKPSIELRIPYVKSGKQKKDSNVKKTYSDDDLSAAVTEIRNGKLGTRRAASLYGIPRSTLRNKVFKMEVDDPSLMMMDDEESNSNESVIPPPSLPPSFNIQSLISQDRPLQLSDLLQLSTMQYLAPIAMPFMFNQDLANLTASEDTEWEKKLQQIRHKHNLSKSSMHQYRQKALSHKLKPFQHDLIKKLIIERLEMEHKASQMTLSEQLLHLQESYIHPGVLKSRELNTFDGKSLQMTKHSKAQSQDKNSMTQSALLKALNMEPLVPVSLAGLGGPSVPLSDIVIPAYNPIVPSSSKMSHDDDTDKKSQSMGFKYENTRIGDTLKGIIVKSISKSICDKVRCKLESADFSSLAGSSSNVAGSPKKRDMLSAFSVPGSPSPVKKIKQEPIDPDTQRTKPSTSSSSSSLSSSSTSSNASGSQTKKTRPKRGQYRKYNSQLLTEAVKAVQRGEMSVHRAGSYYGVPHSTLEYKVKERHLLRQKKIKEQQEAKLKKDAEDAKKKEENQTPTREAAATATNAKPSADSSKLAADLLNISPPKSFTSWLPPFAGPTPLESAAALGLFGSGFALNTPASELLRKLQHKVQTKSGTSEETSQEDTSDFSSSSEGYMYVS